MKRWVYHVYRAYADDELIYVGCTRKLWERLNQHRRYSWWSLDVTRVHASVVHANIWADDRVARIAETKAIFGERPRWNLNDLERALLPTWTEAEFAAHLRLWLVNEHNTRRWQVERLGKPDVFNSKAKFDRLVRRWRLHHGASFDLSLLDGCEPRWTDLPTLAPDRAA